MKRRDKPYRPKPKWCPPLVVCSIHATEADLQNHVRLDRLRSGTADSHDFNWLLDTQAALLLGAHHISDVATVKVAVIAQEVFRSIRTRFEKCGKFGCTGDEFNLLCSMVEINEAWWPRQKAETLLYAQHALNTIRGLSENGNSLQKGQSGQGLRDCSQVLLGNPDASDIGNVSGENVKMGLCGGAETRSQEV